ncbi:hypothetical protein B0T17DRAFT_620585 [Bombardia bombarda]|uniref:Uncharacterized protein n=1 Tax=Bombardia bombarda TaxID=252184 RepID=A0AA39T280_9PEZI|nr:hypothetical protein B0T17DRAFT_620585 [Bombardia bombarda]
MFRGLVSVVRRIADKIYNKTAADGGTPDPQPENRVRPPDSHNKNVDDTARIRGLVEGQKARIKKLEDGAGTAYGSFHTESERQREISSLKKQVETTEGLLDWTANNQARHHRILGAKNQPVGTVET